ncbi:hypothetical protein C0992_004133 [Termitomyces sp. T32_za158]|nr:hypothetical protein C0992_004133 [Termitomyces sp. T32_za158]
MWSTAREIAAGDVVIIWLTRDYLQPLVITPGKEFNSKFGHYRHSDLVGMPYGSKVGSRKGKGFIHVLRPTPELWTMALPHRTQILYLADIAFITSHLDIKPGSRVIEAGFTDITMYETLLRPVEVSHVPVPQPICDISEKLKRAERKREDKRLQQIAAGEKRKRDDTTPVKDQSEEASEVDTAAGERKRLKISDESTTVVPEPLQEMDLDPNEVVGLTPSTPTLVPSPSLVQIPPSKINLSKVIPEVRGHTSYLTFASLIPFAFPETEPSTAAATPGGAAD